MDFNNLTVIYLKYICMYYIYIQTTYTLHTHVHISLHVCVGV